MAMDFPASPSVGQQVLLGGNTYIWDGTAWNIIPQMGPSSISDLPPSNPAVGQFWWRATNGQLYIYVNDGNTTQWVQAAGFAQQLGSRETLFNGSFSGLLLSAGQVVNNLSGFSDLFMTFNTEGGGAFAMQYSSDNGATWYTTAASYTYNQVFFFASPATTTGNTTTQALVVLIPDTVAGSTAGGSQHISEFNKAKATHGEGNYNAFASGTGWNVGSNGHYHSVTTAMNALKFGGAASGQNGHMLIEGVRG